MVNCNCRCNGNGIMNSVNLVRNNCNCGCNGNGNGNTNNVNRNCGCNGNGNGNSNGNGNNNVFENNYRISFKVANQKDINEILSQLANNIYIEAYVFDKRNVDIVTRDWQGTVDILNNRNIEYCTSEVVLYPLELVVGGLYDVYNYVTNNCVKLTWVTSTATNYAVFESPTMDRLRNVLRNRPTN